MIKLIAITLFYSGIRIGECLSLQIGDVDFSRKVLKIRDAKGKAYRVVPLHEKLQWLLQKHLKGKNLKNARSESPVLAGFRFLPKGVCPVVSSRASPFQKLPKGVVPP